MNSKESSLKSSTLTNDSMSDKKEEELDKVSLAVASTISKSSTFTKFSSNSLMNQKSSIGGF